MIWKGFPSRRNLPFSTRKEWGAGAWVACAVAVRAKRPERTKAERSLKGFLIEMEVAGGEAGRDSFRTGARVMMVSEKRLDKDPARRTHHK
jgi:hypothetical protein